MLDSLARLTDDAAGIEKTLRLFQGFATIAAGMSQPIEAASWAQARSELALGKYPGASRSATPTLIACNVRKTLLQTFEMAPMLEQCVAGAQQRYIAFDEGS